MKTGKDRKKTGAVRIVRSYNDLQVKHRDFICAFASKNGLTSRKRNSDKMPSFLTVSPARCDRVENPLPIWYINVLGLIYRICKILIL